ncbi:MAG: CRTAC1 family protein [Phycisphaerales bacterium]|nr:CRTAC1 family protein [Phycisphaerales bacterium]
MTREHFPIPILPLLFMVPLAGCKQSSSTPPADKPPPAPSAAANAPPTAAVPHFTDVLKQSGIAFRHQFLDSETGTDYRINPYDHGSGVYLADVDGDGLDDIYFLNFLGPNVLYRNKGDFTFEDITAGAGVAVDRSISVGGAFGDYDNDGDQDLYVTTYRGGNHLFRNNGQAVFEDVTAAASVVYNGHSSAAAWVDVDIDGDLDLYLCNIGKFTTETISKEADYFYTGLSLPFATLAQKPDQRVTGERDILYRNNGDGTFTDVTQESGIQSVEWNADVAAADYDLDGDPDLYVTNMFGANHLYRNRGDGKFDEVTAEKLKRTSWGAMGCTFFDADGDQYPDLYVVDMHSDMWIPDPSDQSLLKPADKFNNPLGSTVNGGLPIGKGDDTLAKTALFGNTFFLNNGDGTFDERSRESHLETWWPWGITTGDYDNDGDVDAYVATGMGYPFFYWPNRFYLNDGHGVFREAAQSAGLEPPAAGMVIAGAEIKGKPFTRSSRAAATADFDRDGDLDMVVNNFNHEPYLFRNDSPKSSYVGLRLRGVRANRDGIGARIAVETVDKTRHRWRSGAEGYLTQNGAVIHVGLGSADAVKTVTIHWPGDPNPQIIDAPAINRVIDIVQH